MLVSTPTVLLYSPRPLGAVDYQAALEAAGYRVVRSSTVAGCGPYLDGGADVVLLDDPPWDLARGLVAALEAGPLSLPRIWVSSWSMAPTMAGKLGVDALLLEPRDVDAVVAQIRRAIVPTRTGDAGMLRRPRATTETTVAEAPPGLPIAISDDETSDS